MAKTTFEFFQLRCFVTVAEELNFTRAAQRLNMTQPPLSRQIKLLEAGIGMTLLDRNKRSVRLTPAGATFRAAAIDLLERAEQAVLIARQAERGEGGTITMGFVPSAALEFVPRIVTALKRDLPDVRFTPIEMMS
ncbi:MAG: LysR family transcriptional regulator, partial [Erythrobacter sp.]